MPRHIHDGRRLSCPGCRLLAISAALERAAEELARSTDILGILRMAASALKDEVGSGTFKSPRPYRMSKAIRDAKVASGKKLAEQMRARRLETEKEQ